MRLYNFLKTNLNLTKTDLDIFKLNHTVTVNDVVIPYSTIINENDIIKVDNKIIKPSKKLYYLYYKPKGILSTISNKKESYINNISVESKVTPAGRLDKDSFGLLILSNDGKFLNELTGDKSTIDKEYIITVKEEITEAFIDGMSKSYEMDGKYTTPAVVKKIDNNTASVILYEGLYHQIRRLVKLNHYTLINLKRIRIGKYYLDDMKPGEIREIKKAE